MLNLQVCPVVIMLCGYFVLDPLLYYLQTHTRPFLILYNYQIVLQVWCFPFSFFYLNRQAERQKGPTLTKPMSHPLQN